MPRFSKRSRDNLDTCDERLQRVCERVIEQFDFTVLEGYRTLERQRELLRQGKTKLSPGKSAHNRNPSTAVDVAPYPIDWSDIRRFDILAGFMFQAAAEEGVTLRWGGDWDRDWELSDQTFNDLPHFEIVEDDL